MVKEQAVIEGWRGVAVSVGLGTPSRRGICALLVAAPLLYAMKTPRSAFDQEGRMTSTAQFLLIPLTIGFCTASFT